MRSHWTYAAVAVLMLGCGGTTKDPRTTVDPDPLGGIEPDQAGITKLVQERGYASWKAEPDKHPSAGPHGGSVKTYFNPKLEESLRAGQTRHPVGSVSVKEWFKEGADEVIGHSVALKTKDEGTRTDWVWFEGAAPDYQNSFYGPGAGTCSACHSQGVDFILTPLPR